MAQRGQVLEIRGANIFLKFVNRFGATGRATHFAKFHISATNPIEDLPV